MSADESSSKYAEERRLIELFIDNAKTYVQLSAGALLLTITFMRDVLAIPKEQKIPADPILIASWAAFLLAVVSGALYQYVAIKYLESKSPVKRESLPVAFGLGWAAASPGRVYAAMLLSFYLGAILFTGAAVHALL